MQNLFKRFWQWLQRLLAPFLGTEAATASQSSTQDASPLSDTDYEFLLSQLLEGIAHGWHEGRVLKFFQQLGDRGRTKDWVNWLERFEVNALKSPSNLPPHSPLAARLLRLGELAQAFPQIIPIGQQAHQIARQLYARQAPVQQPQVMWEYVGPDVVQSPESSTSEPPQDDLSMNDLREQLQVNDQLAQNFRHDLGLSEDASPETIVQALMQQFNTAQSELESLPPPETATEWFEMGLKQAQVGELEAAIASWDQALAMEPTLMVAWHNRGSALGNLGQLEAALANFQQAATHDPTDEFVWFNQGMILEALERNTDAIHSYQKALEVSPDLVEAQGRIDHLQALVPE